MNRSLEQKRTFLYWVRAWFPVGLAVLMIALESTELLGSNHTSGPLRWLWEHLFGPVTERAWDLIHHFIRKTGHFTGYGLVALTWLRAFWMTLPRLSFLQNACLALLGAALTASADEFHQTLLPNRTGVASDVLIDCCGAICMQLALFVLLKLTTQTWFDRPV
ncbi:MAG TPA: VanZ family protein [Terracidiphilus sp.]|nr:VanZ family protein [Terracidiphilus sp.]